ncbi:hypothetical protein WJX73_006446 [Symbiochloris irregularis]|uniref:NAD(P)-binding domain-containing protein n=1 Tax=Symbiochloris irregularis TaxID=706552 RepID=A0AAW1NUJ0_9CHLO
MAEGLRHASRQLVKGWAETPSCSYNHSRRAISAQQRPVSTPSIAAPVLQASPGQQTAQRWAWPSAWSQSVRRNTTQTVEAGPEGPSSSAVPALVVFGGNGFVGSRVCQEALKTGLAVISINRSGAPTQGGSWVNDVQWVKADVFSPESWKPQLQGAIGVVSCLGAFGSNEFMYKMCGESNISVFTEAAKAGVPRAAFISVHDYNVPSWVLSGYFQGKRSAEQALIQSFPEAGVAIRPSFVHGSRQVGSVSIPLSAVGVPLDRVLGLLPAKNLASWPVLGLGLTPPVSVNAVAKAAVAAATDPAVPPGVMDLWTIKEGYET